MKAQEQTGQSGLSSLSTETASKRLRDTGRVLALVWACCSTLYVTGATSEVLAMNSGVPALPFFLAYAGIPILIPWASVFITWRWPTVGALMLMAGALLYFVEAQTMAALSRPAMWSILPALLGFLPLVAGGLLLASRLKSDSLGTY